MPRAGMMVLAYRMQFIGRGIIAQRTTGNIERLIAVDIQFDEIPEQRRVGMSENTH